MNAVAVVDTASNTVRGYVPVGWYPTGVVVAPDGKRLFVANAKGVVARTPNDKPVAFAEGESRNRYIQNILEGTVSTIDIARVTADLTALTAQTLANNRIVPKLSEQARTALRNPGIKHVIYIIKENRTYDQVLGDLPQGNGDPSLVMFGRDVTRISMRWRSGSCFSITSTAARRSPGTAGTGARRGWRTRMSRETSPTATRAASTPMTTKGPTTVSRSICWGFPMSPGPRGGYLWDAAAKARLDYRNYGFFTDDLELPRKTAEEGTEGLQNAGTKKALRDRTSPDFRQYDLNYTDSDAWVAHKVPAFPRQMTKFGKYAAPSRFSAWKRDFDGFVQRARCPSS
jgi:hypothetical protein